MRGVCKTMSSHIMYSKDCIWLYRSTVNRSYCNLQDHQSKSILQLFKTGSHRCFLLSSHIFLKGPCFTSLGASTSHKRLLLAKLPGASTWNFGDGMKHKMCMLGKGVVSWFFCCCCWLGHAPTKTALCPVFPPHGHGFLPAFSLNGTYVSKEQKLSGFWTPN